MKSKCGIIVWLLFTGIAGANTIPLTSLAQNDPEPSGAADVLALGEGTDQEWTTTEVAGLTGNLFELITTLGGDNSEIAALFAPGSALSSYGEPATAHVASPPVTPPRSLASVPEPATMGLLGAALLLFGLYGARRVTRINSQHGPPQQPD